LLWRQQAPTIMSRMTSGLRALGMRTIRVLIEPPRAG
jgi:hypothetical protein